MKKFYAFSLMILGGLLIVFGGALMLNPDMSLRALTVTIAILLILNGLNEIIIYFQARKFWRITKWSLIEGILALGIGIFTIMSPNIAERVFIIIFAFWILVSAFLHMTVAFVVRPISGWFLLLLLGAITATLAIASFFTTTIAAITVAVMLGLFFISLGLTWIVMGWLSLKYLSY